MSSLVGLNLSASQIASGLNSASSSLQSSILELSSGSLFTRSSADPGEQAVAVNLGGTISDSQATQSNIADAVSMLQTQGGALSDLGNVLTQMSQVAMQYNNPVLSPDEQADYQTEFSQLQQTASDIAATSFNGQAVFSNNGNQTVQVQTSPDGSQSASIAKPDLASSGQPLSQVLSADLANLTPDNVSQALDQITSYQAQNGASTSQLQFASQNLTATTQNLQSADSQISDANVAQVSTQYASSSLQTDISAALLSQANVSSAAALSVLGV